MWMRTRSTAKRRSYPNAKKYRDYRKMFDEMGKQIDGVTVSIPDHSHGPATALALHMGKACLHPEAARA